MPWPVCMSWLFLMPLCTSLACVVSLLSHRGGMAWEVAHAFRAFLFLKAKEKPGLALKRSRAKKEGSTDAGQC